MDIISTAMIALSLLIGLGCILMARPIIASGISDISVSGLSIPVHDAIEITFSVDATYNNYSDPADIDVSAIITKPDLTSVLVPAYYSGSGNLWKIRYSPDIKGDYRFMLSANTTKGTIRKNGSFTAQDSNLDGFIRIDRTNSQYLVFDSGKPFFGIGHNIAWTSKATVDSYKKYFSKLKSSGCNMARVWINNSWSLPIESKKVGEYDFRSSKMLDEIIEAAKESGIYIVLSLDSYGSLLEKKGEWNEEAWATNPYNMINGGPCSSPFDFFTNEEAKRLYKNKLRYIVARWGCSANILAFELWNECDSPIEWTKEMAGYLKSINPHRTLATTSLGYPWGNNFNESAIWALDEIDLIQPHIYANRFSDVTGHILKTVKETVKDYKKPIFIGEFGIDSGRSDIEIDPQGIGVALHNSLWASLVSGSFSTALNWWWEDYIYRKDLYYNYSAISRFIFDLKWNRRKVSFLEISPVTLMNNIGAGVGANSELSINTQDIWGETRYSNFIIRNDGEVEGGEVNRYLHGNTKKEIRLEPVFVVNFPNNGSFAIDIGLVSIQAELVIYMDDKEVYRRIFPTGEGEGPWKKCMYRKDKKIFQCLYNETVSIPVTKGYHKIRLVNNGKDWIGIKKITLGGYKTSLFADARASGLLVDDTMIVWIQNRKYKTRLPGNKELISPVKDTHVTIGNVTDGRYLVEWWDTKNGSVVSSSSTTAIGGSLKVNIPEFSEDTACKITENK